MCGVIIKKTKYGWSYVRNMYLISIHTNVDHSSRKTLSRKENVEKGKHFKQSSFKQEKNGNENRSKFPVSISFTMNCPRRDIYQAVLNNLKRQFNSNCQPINVHQKHFQIKEYFFCSSFIFKNIFLSMCDVKRFLTFTSPNMVLLWQLFYLFCSCI